MPEPTASLDLYQEIKSWQGAIGSVLGFLALMAAALWNFHLNRRRDALLRREEALSVAVALYGEILLLRREAALLARAVAATYIRGGTRRVEKSDFNAHFIENYKLSEPMLYKELASKIGLLSPPLILSITEFHANLQDANSCLPLLVDDPSRNFSYSPNFVLIPARDAVVKIIPALRTIEEMARIAIAADTPDLGDAEAVIEMEEDMHAG